jgi:hypothetical protein
LQELGEGREKAATKARRGELFDAVGNELKRETVGKSFNGTPFTDNEKKK